MVKPPFTIVHGRRTIPSTPAPQLPAQYLRSPESIAASRALSAARAALEYVSPCQASPRDYDPPDGTESVAAATRRLRKAARACHTCHVLPECRALAGANPGVAGVLAGRFVSIGRHDGMDRVMSRAPRPPRPRTTAE